MKKRDKIRTKAIGVKLGGIRLKLIGAFLIPVILIVILGVLSTIKASEAIINNYEEAMKNTIQKTADYYGILFQNVDTKSKELSNDNTIRNYYGGAYAGDNSKESDTYNQVMAKVRSAESNDVNIGLACLIAPYGRCAITSGNITADSYAGLIADSEGKSILASGDAGVWSGRHRYMDALLSLNEASYGISVSRPVIGNSLKPVAILIMDIKTESIQMPLLSIELPEGSVCSLVTSDGREIGAQGAYEQQIFYGTGFYEEAVNEGAAGEKELELEGEEYIYVYAPVTGGSGCTIHALIPKAMVMAQADEIKGLTFIMIVIAIIIAFAVGMIMAFGMGQTIQKMNRMAGKAAQGDLTGSVKAKGHDEFSMLARHLEDMFEGMKRLIRGAANVSDKILYSSETVSDASEKMVNVSKEISDVIEAMETGLERQAEDAKKCLQKMDSLEEKVETVYKGVRQIEAFAGDTKVIVNKGIQAVGELDVKANETADITKTVIDNIMDLKAKSAQIENFSGMISNIARQTNLLSLNASIEAARAGESGRGFSVVADEIRKLAEDSMKAAGEINSIIQNIGQMTDHTANTAKEAEETVRQQSVALKNTVETLNDITRHVEGLSGNIGEITYGVKDIAEAKDVTREAVERITEVLNQTAVTANQVQAAAINQVNASEELSREAESLSMQSKELKGSIGKFRIASSEADTALE